MRFKSELFAHFVYSQELSYEELLTTEETFQEAVTQILNDEGAQFINFTAFGDTYGHNVFLKFMRSLFSKGFVRPSLH